jgi:mono/diheme cytochrome c family protein
LATIRSVGKDRRRPLALGAGVLLVAGLLATGWWLALEWRQRAEVLLGQRLYAERCAACHGKNLEGQANWKVRLPNGRLPAPPHNAEGHTWHHTDEELFLVTRDGLAAIVPGYESDMPPFRDLMTDHEIRAVIEFIKSTWPERERAYQTRRSETSSRRRVYRGRAWLLGRANPTCLREDSIRKVGPSYYYQEAGIVSALTPDQWTLPSIGMFDEANAAERAGAQIALDR